MRNNIVTLSMLSLSTAMVLGMTGCSEGGLVDSVTTTTTTTTTVPTSISGKAIDGEISGATVCIDMNTNSRCDADEDSTTTDVFGNYTLESTQRGNLLLIGGTDMGTGKAFTGSLTAPANSQMITPLTSMVQALVSTEAGKEVTAAEAEVSLKKALGIPATVALTTFEPFQEARNSNEEAKSVLAAQGQVQTLVHGASASVAGADTDTSIADSMASITKSLATSLKEAVAVAEETGNSVEVEISPAIVTKATKDAANEVFAAKPAAKVAAKAVAESAAVDMVETAKQTKANIEAATLADAEDTLNTGMVLANTTLEKVISERVEAVAMYASHLSAVDVEAIADVQAYQEAKAAATVGAEVELQRKVKAAVDAKAEAEEAGSTQAQIVAAAAAGKAAAKAAEAKAVAEAVAAAAAEAAAVKEAQIAAAIAQEKEAVAKAAAAAAEAAAALAKIEAATQEEARAKAVAAADAAAAQAAANEALEAAAVAIAVAQLEADIAAKILQDLAEALAQAAAHAADAAQAAAEQAAKDAEALLAAAAQCESDNGTWTGTTCTLATSGFTRENEIVTDLVTGLMWQDDAEAATTYIPWLLEENNNGNYDNTSGSTATTYCSQLSLGGDNDWRLPTKDELEGMIDYSFENVSSSYYWSSSMYEDFKSDVWVVNFDYGIVNASYKNNNFYVRCVRGVEKSNVEAERLAAEFAAAEIARMEAELLAMEVARAEAERLALESAGN